MVAVERQDVVPDGQPRRVRIAPRDRGTRRDMPLPNMPTFDPSSFVTNSSSSIASSGVCIGMIAAGVIRSLRLRK